MSDAAGSDNALQNIIVMIKNRISLSEFLGSWNFGGVILMIYLLFLIISFSIYYLFIIKWSPPAYLHKKKQTSPLLNISYYFHIFWSKQNDTSKNDDESCLFYTLILFSPWVIIVGTKGLFILICIFSNMINVSRSELNSPDIVMYIV